MRKMFRKLAKAIFPSGTLRLKGNFPKETKESGCQELGICFNKFWVHEP